MHQYLIYRFGQAKTPSSFFCWYLLISESNLKKYFLPLGMITRPRLLCQQMWSHLILRQLFIDRSSIEINTPVFFLGKCVGPPQKPCLWTEKNIMHKTTEYSFELFLSIYRYFNTAEESICYAGSPKHGAIFRQEKMAFPTPVGLPWDSPPPAPASVQTGIRAHTDVTTKISRIDRLPDLLTNGAPLITGPNMILPCFAWL